MRVWRHPRTRQSRACCWQPAAPGAPERRPPVPTAGPSWAVIAGPGPGAACPPPAGCSPWPAGGPILRGLWESMLKNLPPRGTPVQDCIWCMLPCAFEQGRSVHLCKILSTSPAGSRTSSRGQPAAARLVPTSSAPPRRTYNIGIVTYKGHDHFNVQSQSTVSTFI